MRHLRTRPYTPRTNGKAERLVQTSLREWAYARSYANSEQRAHALQGWLHHYNWHRPQAGLGYRPPHHPNPTEQRGGSTQLAIGVQDGDLRISGTGPARLAAPQSLCRLPQTPADTWQALDKLGHSAHEGDVKIAGADARDVVGCAGQRRHAV